MYGPDSSAASQLTYLFLCYFETGMVLISATSLCFVLSSHPLRVGCAMGAVSSAHLTKMFEKTLQKPCQQRSVLPVS